MKLENRDISSRRGGKHQPLSIVEISACLSLKYDCHSVWSFSKDTTCVKQLGLRLEKVIRQLPRVPLNFPSTFLAWVTGTIILTKEIKCGKARKPRWILQLEWSEMAQLASWLIKPCKILLHTPYICWQQIASWRKNDFCALEYKVQFAICIRRYNAAHENISF